MGLDRNSIIGFSLIILIYLGFTIYNSKEESEYLKKHPKTEKSENKYPVGDSSNGIANDTIKTNTANAKPLEKVDTTNSQKLGGFTSFALGNEQLITIENEDCIYTFSNKGGVIKKVELKDYKTFTKKPLILFEDHGNDLIFRLF
jgi:YidC/Oxa1 family membrane protein insertase